MFVLLRNADHRAGGTSEGGLADSTGSQIPNDNC